MFAGLRHLKSLTAAQRAALIKKRIEGEYTIDALLAELRPLAEFDAVGDRGRDKLGWFGGMALMVAFFAFVLTVILTHPIPLVVMVLAVLVAIYAFVQRRRLGRFDAADNLREVALPFLRVLAKDLPPAGRLQLRLDFSDSEHKAWQQGDVQHDKLGGAKTRTTFYRHDWFSGAARLVDGSLLRWQLVDGLAVRVRTRRNPRGKYKTKTKRTQRSRLRVQLVLPRRRYEALAPDNPGVTTDERHVTVRLEHRLKTPYRAPVPVDELLALVGMAYGNVRRRNREERS